MRRGAPRLHPQQFSYLVAKGGRAARSTKRGSISPKLALSFRVEVEDRDTLDVVKNLSRDGALKLGGRADRKIGLGDRVVEPQQPPPQPTCRRDATGAGEAVRLVRLEEIDALAEAKPAIDQLHLTKRIPASLDVEKVAGTDRHQCWLGGAHGQVIGMIEAGGHLAIDVLLGVLGPDRGEQTLKRGDVTRRGRGQDTVVKAHQVRGQGSSA